MITVVETFIYEIPNDQAFSYVSLEDYYDFVNNLTCPFYDGDDRFVPEKVKISRTFVKKEY